jgi:hypothetical protein
MQFANSKGFFFANVYQSRFIIFKFQENMKLLT